jgi:chemotaxis protein histidine kinase CheA
MATSEIEKLERRYAENPHGLTFAPLAEVHRKNGDVTRALELLTAGLELHPNYIPASIVLGRCHQDLGDLPSAEAAFAHVLRLDDENVIALKSLADINEKLEHFSQAGDWLRRLVSVDRSNEEARDQLQRVEAKEIEAKAKEQEQKAEAAAEVETETEPAPSSTFEVIDLGSETASEEEQPAAASAEPETFRAAAGHIEPTGQVSEPTELAPSAETVEPPEYVAAEPEGPPAFDRSVPEPDEESPTDAPARAVPGLISAEFVPPLSAIGGLGVETSEDLVLEVSGESEFRVPDASEDFKSLAERMSAPQRSAPTPDSESDLQVPEEAPRAVVPPDPEPVAPPDPEPVAPAEPEPVAAESQPIGAPTPQRSYLASQTSGRSVAAFFHALLAARPPADGGTGGGDNNALADSHGSRPAPGGGALKSFAGEDNLPVPPAVPSPEKTDGAVSFDDFFGSEAEKATPLRQRADPGKDDLDQFQTWLQNLKR